MTVQEKRANFKSQMMDSSRMKVLCGAFDGITARAAQAADFFDGCYMGGQAAAASLLGVPDLGLVCGCEQTKHAQDLASCVDLPFLIDADTGYGNELKDVYKRQTMSSSTPPRAWAPASGWPAAGPTGPSSSPPPTLLPFGTPSAPWVSWTFCGRFIW